MTDAPMILWFRRDLRLADHPMLAAAVATGRPVIPVFVLDPETEVQGAAAKWRLGLSLADFSERLAGLGSRLVFRRGPALEVLTALVRETGATAVRWTRAYDPVSRARDQAVKAGLVGLGLEAGSVPGHLLHEPWDVATGGGGFYKVFTPYWRAVQGREVAALLPAPVALVPPAVWPESEVLTAWTLGAGMARGAAVAAPWQRVGEAAALARLDGFLAGPVAGYAERRDFMAEDAASGLSENLTYGEIGPRQVWHAGWRAWQEGQAGAETFLKELVWREFAYHLVYHSPQITTRNWRAEWDGFAWRGDNPDAERWRRGMTGEPVVDAAMRQMYVTGTMHNRARMIVASYLTKHLLTDWRVGQAWFADCLTDWDPASNAMGWQWVAGSGPDAAPYFRIFNPATQAEKFDPEGVYRRRWLDPVSPRARAFFDAVPKEWGMAAGMPYPAAVIGLAQGRARALAALQQRNA
jgi:deoxyribodipyrimidine photo-lyase